MDYPVGTRQVGMDILQPTPKVTKVTKALAVHSSTCPSLRSIKQSQLYVLMAIDDE